MRLARSNSWNDAMAGLRRFHLGCVITVVGFAGGCSTLDLPADTPLSSQMSGGDDQIAEIRETALADPFPTAAEAGLDSKSEPDSTDE